MQSPDELVQIVRDLKFAVNTYASINFTPLP
jgi:hypothetical protein